MNAPALFDNTPGAAGLTLTVACKARWPIHWGGCNNPGGGIDGQLTKCRLSNGLTVYVRENLAQNHFTTTAGARMAMKRGETAGGVEVLELCCPAEWWDVVAELVRQADPKGRRVRPSRNFTAAWAERVLREAERGD